MLRAISGLVSAALTEYMPISSTAVKVGAAMTVSSLLESMSMAPLASFADRVLGRRSIRISATIHPQLFKKIQSYLLTRFSKRLMHLDLSADHSFALREGTSLSDAFGGHSYKLRLEQKDDKTRDWDSVVIESRTATFADVHLYLQHIRDQEGSGCKVTIENDAVKRVSSAEGAIYSKLEEYMVLKHIGKIQNCGFVPKNGEITVSVNSASFERSVQETFRYNNIDYAIVLTMSTPPSPSENKNNTTQVAADRIVIETRTGDVEVLKRFVEWVVSTVDGERLKNQSKVLRVYRPVIVESKDHPEVYWNSVFVRTSKTFANTIVAANVQCDFIDDVKRFMSSERIYAERGLPYRRGFLLWGLPGTGKTSLVKAVANEYSCDVFSIDLETITKNNQLTKLLNDVAYLAGTKKYILVMEDVDRSPLFNGDLRLHRHFNDGDRKGKTNAISMGTFLNAIDGVVEANRRLLILTANNIDSFLSEENKALMRPGRIDQKVEMGYSDGNQIAQLFRLFFKDQPAIEESKIQPPRSLTSAELTNLFVQYENTPDQIRNFLYGIPTDESNGTALHVPPPTAEEDLKQAASKTVDQKLQIQKRHTCTLLRIERNKLKKLETQVKDFDKKLKPKAEKSIAHLQKRLLTIDKKRKRISCQTKFKPKKRTPIK